MNAPSSPPITDDELHAFVDDRLAPDARAAFERRLADDPAAAERARDWRLQRDELRALFASTDSATPIPSPMRSAAIAADATHARGRRTLRASAIAASVFVAFAAGWLGRGAWPGAHGAYAAEGSLASNFARQAMVAHVVYAPEVRHPVEVTAAQQDHLVQWLSKRLGRPLKVPSLKDDGYELVGGRLLPGDTGARAQFMFQNAGGTRVTLYVGALDQPGAKAGETAFRFVEDDGANGFYWVENGTGYALAGQMPRSTLLDIATSVHKQLGLQ